MSAQARQALRGVAALAVLTGAVIGFIAGLSSSPLLNYDWSLPIIGALLSLGLLLRWVSEYEA